VSACAKIGRPGWEDTELAGLTKRSVRRVAVAVSAAVLVSALAALTYTLAHHAGMERLSGQLRDRLTVTLRSVESEIERFGYLPEVMGEDERIRVLLDRPSGEAVASANEYLETIATHAVADAAYIIDRDGLTLAASNWDQPISFVGHNYSFRPYFADALATGQGSYYAVGVTTGIPGYFLSARIAGASGPLGVAVVKVDMAPLERAWVQAGEVTGLADEAGVVFLTGVGTWKYRPLHRLDAENRELIARERRYDGIDVADSAPVMAAPLAAGQPEIVETDRGTLMMSVMHIEPQGWQVFTALPTAPVAEEAQLIAGLAALLSLVCILIGLFAYQRRQITRLKLEQNAVLERRVAERTEALGLEIEERMRTEAELRDTQDSLIHAAKLAALGRMSAAIVHEVSQPLSALDTTLAAADLHARNGRIDKTERSIRSGRELLKRMQRTVRHLRSFSTRTQVLPVEPISLAGSVSAAMEIVLPRARELGVTIAFAPGADLPMIAANAVRIEQVIINLLLNALDATAALGNTAIAVSVVTRRDCALMTIEDSGAGIPEEIAEKITEPFFTTKTTGEGLGLGLSISRAILEDYKGTLAFAPARGGGTLTTVALPLVPARAALEAVS
jgi:two-component system C4-dicarboxylate transport sensor histidine kinase DctB